MWASRRPSRTASSCPRASGIAFCPPLPPSRVGLRLDSLHLHRNFQTPHLPTLHPGANPRHLCLGCGLPALMYLSLSTPHVGGRRQNLTDLPWIHCGTQGALLHAANSRFPHRDRDGSPSGCCVFPDDNAEPGRLPGVLGGSPWQFLPHARLFPIPPKRPPALRAGRVSVRHTLNRSLYLPLGRQTPPGNWGHFMTPRENLRFAFRASP